VDRFSSFRTSARAPRFHHWNGRIYLVAAVITAMAGLYMELARSHIPSVVMQAGSVLDALLILLCAAMALRYALARDFKTHRRWALRLFLVVSASWFFRVELMFWIAIMGVPSASIRRRSRARHRHHVFRAIPPASRRARNLLPRSTKRGGGSPARDGGRAGTAYGRHEHRNVRGLHGNVADSHSACGCLSASKIQGHNPGSSMTDLSAFPITTKWPARYPDRLQLYSLPTPNGVKVSVMLEETGLPYEPHLVRFDTNDQMSPEFLSLSPNNKIPAILDPNGPDGKPLPLFESGAILIYLADKTGQFMPRDPAGRYETIQWLMFQMGGIGPMFGQLGFFSKFAGKDYEDKRPRDRYVAESKRLLAVLERRLADQAWIVGDAYTIADMATFPWVRNLIGFYEAGDLVGIADFPNVTRVLDRFLARPAVARGVDIPERT
jgi:GSH-dependent disulfide-bond oxidoreductase